MQSARRSAGLSSSQTGIDRGAAMAEYLPGTSSGLVRPEDSNKEHLCREYESLWNKMKECQKELMLLGTETLQDTDEKLTLLMMQMKALSSEYKQWQKRTPELISTDQDMVLGIAKEELKNLKSGLEMVLEAVQTKNKQLTEDLKREHQWHMEQEQILDTITQIEEETKTKAAQPLKLRTRKELQDKLSELKLYKEELTNAMNEFLHKHFPLPKEAGSADGKNYSEEPAVKMITLSEMLMILINKLMNTPHEPYVKISDSFWPPYVELVLRYGIALRHPEDTTRIRIEAFHK